MSAPMYEGRFQFSLCINNCWCKVFELKNTTRGETQFLLVSSSVSLLRALYVVIITHNELSARKPYYRKIPKSLDENKTSFLKNCYIIGDIDIVNQYGNHMTENNFIT